jgi:UDPglucose 6-dehydrogenase
VTAPITAYVGMTHLGLCSAVAAASKGFVTKAIDLDAALTARLNAGDLPVVEPGLDALLGQHRATITFSSDPAALRACDVIYVAPDVPTDDTSASDLSGLDRLLELTLANSGPNAVVVVLSQVPPGYTRARQRPGHLLFYQVETLIFGRAVERATTPERFIVGCPDPSQPLPAPLDQFLRSFGCPILPMRFESAELCKIAINCCLVSSIAVANTLAELCEGIGANWSEIVPALKLDRRIGAYAYLAPGLGIAGGNLERDLATVVRFADRIGSDAGVVKAWIANSQHRRNWAVRTIREATLAQNPGATVAVWGLAYKENTASIKNSPSIATIKALPDVKLVLHDPVVKPSLAQQPKAVGAPDALSALKGADALMILTPWQDYRTIAPANIAAAMRGRVVLDPYAVLDTSAAHAAGLLLYTLGRAPMAEKPAQDRASPC